MNATYDMCVNYETLCEIEDKLQLIEHNLNNSTEIMFSAIERSQEFLSGNQFEKAKNTTKNCLELTEKTSINIKQAKDYIAELRTVLNEYGMCSYNEEV